MGKAWTVSDQDYLREHCNTMSDAEIAAAIGRSINSVKIKKQSSADEKQACLVCRG